MKKTILASLFITATCLVSLAISQDETMDEVPAVQFSPADDAVILPGLQVYPVFIVHEKPMPDAPSMYVSVYFRDCAQRYLKVKIVFLEIQTPDGRWKARFKVSPTQGSDNFQKPQLLTGGLTEDVLSEEGKKMLRTTELSYIAELENPAAANGATLFLKDSRSAVLSLEFLLEEKQDPTNTVKHTFALSGKHTHVSVIRYANGDNPINTSMIVPEIPPGCVKN